MWTGICHLGIRAVFLPTLSTFCQPHLSESFLNLGKQLLPLVPRPFSSWFRVESKGLFWESTADRHHTAFSWPQVLATPPQKLHKRLLHQAPCPMEAYGLNPAGSLLSQSLPCPEVPELQSGGGCMQGSVLAKVLCWKGGQDPAEPIVFCHVMYEVGEALGELRVGGLAWTLSWGSLASGLQWAVTLFTSLSFIFFIYEAEIIIPAHMAVVRIKLNHTYKILCVLPDILGITK